MLGTLILLQYEIKIELEEYVRVYFLSGTSLNCGR